MLASVWWSSEKSRHRIPATILVVPAIVALWFQAEVGPFAPLAWTVFLLYPIALLFMAVMRPGVSNLDRVLAAVSVYLLIAVTFGYLHQMVMMLDSTSYRMPIDPMREGNTDMLYFSFVTILTLGFGDIIPLSPFARMLTVTEALIGVFFIAILIARLISLRDEPAENSGPTRSK
jgi:hypothetical protein